MGFRIEGPHIVAFLEFASQQYPDAESFRDLSKQDQDEIVQRFAEMLPVGLSSADRELRDVVRYGFRRIVEAGFSVVHQRRRMFGSHEGEDALQRYKSAKYKSIFLYTEHDQDFVAHLENSWRPFDRESGSLLHFFDYGLDGGIGRRRTRNANPYTYTEDYIRGLAPIPAANLARIRQVGLPCCLLWNDQGESHFVPFSDVQEDPVRFRERLRDLLKAAELDEFYWHPDSRKNEMQYGALPKCDVFVSYQHNDRPWVEDLCASIESIGVKPWFDRHLRAGERWDSMIWNMINKAKQVVVVWSSESIHSDYVLAEAHYARVKRKIVPVMKVRDIELPVPFNTLQAIDLSIWKENHSSLAPLVQAINPNAPFQPDR